MGDVRELLLHIGHNKTASSYIQSALTRSVDILASHGIHYPLDERNAAAAAAGQITSGNVGKSEEARAKALEYTPVGDVDRLLLSGEGLFNSLATQKAGPLLDMVRDKVGSAKVRVILFIRDPLDHAVSHYHQAVKRGGFTGEFSDFVNGYLTPRYVKRVISNLNDYGADVEVLNYARHKSNLLNTFEHWLGLPSDTLNVPPIDKVNRSLTLSELELQRLFNQEFGRSAGRFISSPLCADLPDIRSEKPHLTPDQLAAFLDKMRKLCADTMSMGSISEDEAWHIPTNEDAAKYVAPPSDDEPTFEFTQAQLDLLARTIRAQIRRGASA